MFTCLQQKRQNSRRNPRYYHLLPHHTLSIHTHINTSKQEVKHSYAPKRHTYKNSKDHIRSIAAALLAFFLSLFFPTTAMTENKYVFRNYKKYLQISQRNHIFIQSLVWPNSPLKTAHQNYPKRLTVIFTLLQPLIYLSKNSQISQGARKKYDIKIFFTFFLTIVPSR